MKETVEKFLKGHKAHADEINSMEVLEDFRTEMDKGLAGEESSLQMIPTFISPDIETEAGNRVIVIDAGGTNLRIALVEFNADGAAEIIELHRHQMPGIERELSVAEFYAMLRDYLSPVIDKSDRIGFCFSYPAEISENRDGRLLHWTKDIKVPELEGHFIGKGLLASLGHAGNKRLTLLNDTIATLLAGKAMAGYQTFATYIGLILGTGTNTAYIEQNRNITKRYQPAASGSQTINVESGGFAKAPASDFDRELDARSINPGDYLFEKMIGGLYRGKLILIALHCAAEERMFSEEYAEHIMQVSALEAVDADRFMQDKESPLGADALTENDRETAKAIISGLYQRCAKLTAINISAAVLKALDGKIPSDPVCINIDGSTYHKSFGFKTMVEDFLRDIIGSRGIAYELMKVEDAPIIGAAIAACTRD